MTFTDCLNYLGGITSKDVFQLLNDLNGNIGLWAEKSHIPEMAFWIAGLVLAVVIGCAGYKLIRPTIALVVGYFGFFVGVEIYNLMLEKADWWPMWVCWVIAIVMGCFFLSLTLARPSHVLVVLAGIAGYLMMSFYLDNKVFIIGGALLIALVTAHLVRTVYILTSSFFAGLLSVSLLSEIFPKIDCFRLGNKQWIPLLIAIGIALVFALIQGASNRHRGERLY